MEDKLRRWQARIQAFITAWLCCDELVGSFVFGLGYVVLQTGCSEHPMCRLLLSAFSGASVERRNWKLWNQRKLCASPRGFRTEIHASKREFECIRGKFEPCPNSHCTIIAIRLASC